MSDFASSLSSFSTSLSRPAKKARKAAPPLGQKLLTTLQNLIAPPLPPATTRHISFCFIAIDRLPHHTIWLHYFRHLSKTCTISVMIHFKTTYTACTPAEEKFYERFRLPFTRAPTWGSVELASVSLDFLVEGGDGRYEWKEGWEEEVGEEEGGEDVLEFKIDEAADEAADEADDEAADEADDEANDETDDKTDDKTTKKEDGRADTTDDPEEDQEEEQDAPPPLSPPSTPISQFCLLSESCLPLVSPSSFLANLPTASIINLQSSPNNGYAAQLQFDPLRTYFNNTNTPTALPIFKADQWCVLDSVHTNQWLPAISHLLTSSTPPPSPSAANPLPKKPLANTPFLQIFRRTKAPDELVIPFLASLSLATAPSNLLIVDRSTFCDWEGESKNPKTLTLEDAVARKGGVAVFGRKIKEEVSVERWIEVVCGGGGN